MLKPCINEEKGGRDNVKEIRREGERGGMLNKYWSHAAPFSRPIR